MMNYLDIDADDIELFHKAWLIDIPKFNWD